MKCFWLFLPPPYFYFLPPKKKQKNVAAVKRHKRIAAPFNLPGEQWESVGMCLRNSGIRRNCDDLRFWSTLVFRSNRNNSAGQPLWIRSVDIQDKTFLVMWPPLFFPFTEGTENDSSLKPIASNQWGQCIKSEKEHMKPGEQSGRKDGKEGEKVALALNPDRKIN